MKCIALKTGLALASLFAGSLLLGSGAQADGQLPPLNVCVGYADSFRNKPLSIQFPDPWMGSPEVQYFAGQVSGDGTFDAGAIHFENTGGAPITIKGLKVYNFANSATFQIWDSFIGTGLVLDPGKTAIFTQIGGTENFDTSDTPNLSTTPTLLQPKIDLTTDTGTFTYTDINQILNTGGIDRATLGLNNSLDESLGWRPIGDMNPVRGVNDVLGYDCGKSVVPEPSSLALLFTGGLPLLGFIRRRRLA